MSLPGKLIFLLIEAAQQFITLKASVYQPKLAYYTEENRYIAPFWDAMRKRFCIVRSYR